MSDSGGIVMAWCHPGMVHMPFMDCVINAMREDAHSGDVLHGHIAASSSYIPDARNKITASFLDKTQGEWLLSLDYDIIFTYQDIRQLLAIADAVERPVVGGAYYTNWAGGLWPCWWDAPERGPVSPVTFMDSGEVRQIGGCGMGFALIHRGLLERMREFYADDPWHWYAHDLIGGERMGEDISFAFRVKRVGGTIWGAGGVQLGHIKSRTETMATFAAQDFGSVGMGQGVLVRR